MGKDFARVRAEEPAIAGLQAFSRLRDDEGMLLICPTCQIVFRSIHASDCLLPCMGLFSIILVGRQNRVSLAVLLFPAGVSCF